MKKSIFATLVLAGVALASPGYAHHSTNLWYDMKTTQTVEGTFVAMHWTNPHSAVEVAVIGPKGQKETWMMETHASNVLARVGWRPKMFKPGDKLTVTGNPARKKDQHMLSLLEIKTTDGRDFKVNPSN